LIKLSNVVQFVKFVGGSQPAPSSELNSWLPDYTAPPADTRRVLCLHVLSSFQRTGLADRTPPSALFRSGEPFNLTNPARLCQPLRKLSRILFFSATRRRSRRACADLCGVANPGLSRAKKKFAPLMLPGANRSGQPGRVTLGKDHYTRRPKHCQPAFLRRPTDDAARRH